jgi:hypothetical protein
MDGGIVFGNLDLFWKKLFYQKIAGPLHATSLLENYQTAIF